MYDGAQITHSIDPLGYMLGDEGSGSYIGKKLLIAYCREYLPLTLRQQFMAVYGLTKEQIMERVYKDPMANRFCAGFTKFVKQHIDDAFIYQLATDAFQDFMAWLPAELYRTRYRGWRIMEKKFRIDECIRQHIKPGPKTINGIW